MGDYEVIMDGGGPWGIRLQGGKDFGVPLNVARVTPGSKASMKGLLAGDHIISINNNDTEQLTHMEAQNLIKGAGDRLQLRLKKGHGTSLGEAKEIGAGGFKTSPQQTLYQTDVTHSAGVDHKFNAKPKSFITSTNAGGGSAGGVTHVSTPLKKFDPEDYSRKNEPVSAPVKKFDPGEYARKKKEELESYKKDSTKPHDLVDSDVLKMLQKTSVSDPKQTSGLSHGTPDDAGATPTEVPNAPPAPGVLTAAPKTPVFGMAAPNPFQLPIKAVVQSEGANPIMDSLKSRMKEMNIDKEKLDRGSSVSNETKGKYLSQTSRDAAARPKSPSTATLPVAGSGGAPLTAPRSPSNFRSSIKGGGNPTGVEGANVLMGSIKDRLKSDRMTLGLKQTRGVGGGSTQRKLEESQGFKARGTNEPSSDDFGEEL